MYKNLPTNVPTVLFTIAKRQRQPECTLTEERQTKRGESTEWDSATHTHTHTHTHTKSITEKAKTANPPAFFCTL